MTATVTSAPAFLPEGTEAILRPTADDRDHSCQFQHYTRTINCDVPLYIGVFFDGTNNNRERDEPVRGHSNVVRLFNAHPSMSAENPNMRHQGHYAIYVPGVGTRFREGEEWRESMEGKSMAKGAQARILYAVLEVVNSIHRAFSNNIRLLDEAAITAKLKDYVQRVEQGIHSASSGGEGESNLQRETRRAWMQRLNAELRDKLARARKDRPLPHVPFVRVNVFGFSRGAAQARAFCHWLSDLLTGGEIGDLKLEIGFVGLFDCVASVGLADSARRSIGLLGLVDAVRRALGLSGFADGHFSWAAEILGELPAIARCTVHMVAGHEQRLNFPLTRVTGTNVTEIVYPGVHSDVGGGYQARSHGRAETEDQLLSQIPLAHMHRMARRWDVPFVDWLQMGKDLRADYAIHPQLVIHWNDYMQTADSDWQVREGDAAPRMGESTDFDALMRQHRRLYLSWRRRYVHAVSMRELLDTLPIDEQDWKDIHSYNQLLWGDLELLRQRREALRNPVSFHRTAARGAIPLPPFEISDALRKTSNLLPQALAWQPSSREDEGVAWALAQFEGTQVRGEGHFPLLTHQVHDSLAGFYLAGYMTPEDKAEKLLAIVREGRSRGPQSLEPYQRKVFLAFNEASEGDVELAKMIDRRLLGAQQAGADATTGQEKWQAEAEYKKESVFTRAEQERAEKLFPPQTDADAATLPDGMENVARLITNTRREGGGYLLARAIFKGEK